MLPPSHGDDKFYLKHTDDKGDHTVFNDDFNITGIIDWEWAYTALPVHNGTECHLSDAFSLDLFLRNSISRYSNTIVTTDSVSKT